MASLFDDPNIANLFDDPELKAKIDQGFAEIEGFEGFDDIQATLAEQFTALSDSGQFTALIEEADVLFNDPKLDSKVTKGFDKIKNFKGFDSITAKLSGQLATLEVPQEGFDQLNEVLAGGIDLPDDLASKFQQSIDQLNKDGGLQELGNLNAGQLDGLTTELANFNTGFAEGRYNTDIDGLLGKFKMDPSMLQEAGMLQSGVGDKFRLGQLSASEIVNNPSSWKGGSMPGNKAGFLNNPKAQETGFKNALSGFFNKMQSNGGIKPTDTAELQGAMMAVSTKLGPAAAKQWRTVAQPGNTSNKLADSLAQHGAYGISVLGVKK
jgi:hypothetical protein